MSDTEVTEEGCAVLLLGLALFVAEPFVVVKVWRLYLVPLGMPALTWTSATAINRLMAIWRNADGRKSKDGEALRAMTIRWVKLGLLLVIVWAMQWWQA